MSSGLGFGIGAGVEAKLGEVSGDIRESGLHLKGIRGLLRRAQIVSVPIVGNLNGNGSDTVAYNLAGPEGGVEWHVRRITFAPQLGASVSAQGTLLLGKGTGLALASQGSGRVVGTGSGLQSFQFIEIARTTTVPNTILFSGGQCIVRYPLNLIAVWVAGNGQIVIDGDAYEIPAYAMSRAEA